jgi:hypothetical protein
MYWKRIGVQLDASQEHPYKNTGTTAQYQLVQVGTDYLPVPGSAGWQLIANLMQIVANCGSLWQVPVVPSRTR